MAAITEENSLKKIEKHKVLIFDLDDTLIDNLESTRYAFRKMLEQQGEIYDVEKFERWHKMDKKFWEDCQDGLIELPEHFKDEKGNRTQEGSCYLRGKRVLNYFNNTISLEKAIELGYIFRESLAEVVISIEGAFEILEYLSNTEKYHIVIATNGPASAVKEKLFKIDCLQFVKDILSPDMIGGYAKPKIGFFEAIQQRVNNFNNSEFLIIGDSLKSDVDFGMNCGFDSCWFNRKDEETTENYKPTFTIKKLMDLKNIL